MTPKILQKSSQKPEKIQHWGRTWSDVDMISTPGPQYGPQDLHFGPPRLENPSQIHEFRTHFTSNTL